MNNKLYTYQVSFLNGEVYEFCGIIEHHLSSENDFLILCGINDRHSTISIKEILFYTVRLCRKEEIEGLMREDEDDRQND